MTSRLVSIWGAAALLITGTAADAATITNRDEQEQKVTITEGGASSEHTIRPGQTLDNVCMKGCVLRLNDSEEDEYEVDGDDIVAIEEGFLYYDGPDTQPTPGAAGQAPPAPPGSAAPPPPATPQPKQ